MSAAGVAEQTKAKAKHRRSLPATRSASRFISPRRGLADKGGDVEILPAPPCNAESPALTTVVHTPGDRDLRSLVRQRRSHTPVSLNSAQLKDAQLTNAGSCKTSALITVANTQGADSDHGQGAKYGTRFKSSSLPSKLQSASCDNSPVLNFSAVEPMQQPFDCQELSPSHKQLRLSSRKGKVAKRYSMAVTDETKTTTPFRNKRTYRKRHAVNSQPDTSITLSSLRKRKHSQSLGQTASHGDNSRQSYFQMRSSETVTAVVPSKKKRSSQSKTDFVLSSESVHKAIHVSNRTQKAADTATIDSAEDPGNTESSVELSCKVHGSVKRIIVKDNSSVPCNDSKAKQDCTLSVEDQLVVKCLSTSGDFEEVPNCSSIEPQEFVSPQLNSSAARDLRERRLFASYTQCSPSTRHSHKVVEKSLMQCNKESRAVRSIAGRKRCAVKMNKTSMLQPSKTAPQVITLCSGGGWRYRLWGRTQGRRGIPRHFRPPLDQSSVFVKGWEEYLDVFDDFAYFSGRQKCQRNNTAIANMTDNMDKIDDSFNSEDSEVIINVGRVHKFGGEALVTEDVIERNEPIKNDCALIADAVLRNNELSLSHNSSDAEVVLQTDVPIKDEDIASVADAFVGNNELSQDECASVAVDDPSTDAPYTKIKLDNSSCGLVVGGSPVRDVQLGEHVILPTSSNLSSEPAELKQSTGGLNVEPDISVLNKDSKMRLRGKSNRFWHLFVRNSGIRKLGLPARRRIKKTVPIGGGKTEGLQSDYTSQTCQPCSVVLVDVLKCFQLLENYSYCNRSTQSCDPIVEHMKTTSRKMSGTDSKTSVSVKRTGEGTAEFSTSTDYGVLSGSQVDLMASSPVEILTVSQDEPSSASFNSIVLGLQFDRISSSAESVVTSMQNDSVATSTEVIPCLQDAVIYMNESHLSADRNEPVVVDCETSVPIYSVIMVAPPCVEKKTPECINTQSSFLASVDTECNMIASAELRGKVDATLLTVVHKNSSDQCNAVCQFNDDNVETPEAVTETTDVNDVISVNYSIDGETGRSATVSAGAHILEKIELPASTNCGIEEAASQLDGKGARHLLLNDQSEMFINQKEMRMTFSDRENDELCESSAESSKYIELSASSEQVKVNRQNLNPIFDVDDDDVDDDETSAVAELSKAKFELVDSSDSKEIICKVKSSPKSSSPGGDNVSSCSGSGMQNVTDCMPKLHDVETEGSSESISIYHRSLAAKQLDSSENLVFESQAEEQSKSMETASIQPQSNSLYIAVFESHSEEQSSSLDDAVRQSCTVELSNLTDIAFLGTNAEEQLSSTDNDSANIAFLESSYVVLSNSELSLSPDNATAQPCAGELSNLTNNAVIPSGQVELLISFDEIPSELQTVELPDSINCTDKQSDSLMLSKTGVSVALHSSCLKLLESANNSIVHSHSEELSKSSDANDHKLYSEEPNILSDNSTHQAQNVEPSGLYHNTESEYVDSSDLVQSGLRKDMNLAVNPVPLSYCEELSKSSYTTAHETHSVELTKTSIAVDHAELSQLSDKAVLQSDEGMLSNSSDSNTPQSIVTSISDIHQPCPDELTNSCDIVPLESHADQLSDSFNHDTHQLDSIALSNSCDDAPDDNAVPNLLSDERLDSSENFNRYLHSMLPYNMSLQSQCVELLNMNVKFDVAAVEHFSVGLSNSPESAHDVLGPDSVDRSNSLNVVALELQSVDMSNSSDNIDPESHSVGLSNSCATVDLVLNSAVKSKYVGDVGLNSLSTHPSNSPNNFALESHSLELSKASDNVCHESQSKELSNVSAAVKLVSNSAVKSNSVLNVGLDSPSTEQSGPPNTFAYESLSMEQSNPFPTIGLDSGSVDLSTSVNAVAVQLNSVEFSNSLCSFVLEPLSEKISISHVNGDMFHSSSVDLSHLSGNEALDLQGLEMSNSPDDDIVGELDSHTVEISDTVQEVPLETLFVEPSCSNSDVALSSVHEEPSNCPGNVDRESHFVETSCSDGDVELSSVPEEPSNFPGNVDHGTLFVEPSCSDGGVELGSVHEEPSNCSGNVDRESNFLEPTCSDGDVKLSSVHEERSNCPCNVDRESHFVETSCSDSDVELSSVHEEPSNCPDNVDLESHFVEPSCSDGGVELGSVLEGPSNCPGNVDRESHFVEPSCWDGGVELGSVHEEPSNCPGNVDRETLFVETSCSDGDVALSSVHEEPSNCPGIVDGESHFVEPSCSVGGVELGSVHEEPSNCPDNVDLESHFVETSCSDGDVALSSVHEEPSNCPSNVDCETLFKDTSCSDGGVELGLVHEEPSNSSGNVDRESNFLEPTCSDGDVELSSVHEEPSNCPDNVDLESHFVEPSCSVGGVELGSVHEEPSNCPDNVDLESHFVEPSCSDGGVELGSVLEGPSNCPGNVDRESHFVEPSCWDGGVELGSVHEEPSNCPGNVDRETLFVETSCSDGDVALSSVHEEPSNCPGIVDGESHFVEPSCSVGGVELGSVHEEPSNCPDNVDLESHFVETSCSDGDVALSSVHEEPSNCPSNVDCETLFKDTSCSDGGVELGLVHEEPSNSSGNVDRESNFLEPTCSDGDVELSSVHEEPSNCPGNVDHETLFVEPLCSDGGVALGSVHEEPSNCPGNVDLESHVIQSGYVELSKLSDSAVLEPSCIEMLNLSVNTAVWADRNSQEMSHSAAPLQSDLVELSKSFDNVALKLHSNKLSNSPDNIGFESRFVDMSNFLENVSLESHSDNIALESHSEEPSVSPDNSGLESHFTEQSRSHHNVVLELHSEEPSDSPDNNGLESHFTEELHTPDNVAHESHSEEELCQSHEMVALESHSEEELCQSHEMVALESHSEEELCQSHEMVALESHSEEELCQSHEMVALESHSEEELCHSHEMVALESHSEEELCQSHEMVALESHSEEELCHSNDNVAHESHSEEETCHSNKIVALGSHSEAELCHSNDMVAHESHSEEETCHSNEIVALGSHSEAELCHSNDMVALESHSEEELCHSHETVAHESHSEEELCRSHEMVALESHSEEELCQSHEMVAHESHSEEPSHSPDSVRIESPSVELSASPDDVALQFVCVDRSNLSEYAATELSSLEISNMPNDAVVQSFPVVSLDTLDEAAANSHSVDLSNLPDDTAPLHSICGKNVTSTDDASPRLDSAELPNSSPVARPADLPSFSTATCNTHVHSSVSRYGLKCDSESPVLSENKVKVDVDHERVENSEQEKVTNKYEHHDEQAGEDHVIIQTTSIKSEESAPYDKVCNTDLGVPTSIQLADSDVREESKTDSDWKGKEKVDGQDCLLSYKQLNCLTPPEQLGSYTNPCELEKSLCQDSNVYIKQPGVSEQYASIGQVSLNETQSPLAVMTSCNSCMMQVCNSKHANQYESGHAVDNDHITHPGCYIQRPGETQERFKCELGLEVSTEFSKGITSITASSDNVDVQSSHLVAVTGGYQTACCKPDCYDDVDAVSSGSVKGSPRAVPEDSVSIGRPDVGSCVHFLGVSDGMKRGGETVNVISPTSDSSTIDLCAESKSHESEHGLQYTSSYAHISGFSSVSSYSFKESPRSDVSDVGKPSCSPGRFSYDSLDKEVNSNKNSPHCMLDIHSSFKDLGTQEHQLTDAVEPVIYPSCLKKIVAYSCHICRRSFTVHELAKEHMIRAHAIVIHNSNTSETDSGLVAASQRSEYRTHSPVIQSKSDIDGKLTSKLWNLRNPQKWRKSALPHPVTASNDLYTFDSRRQKSHTSLSTQLGESSSPASECRSSAALSTGSLCITDSRSTLSREPAKSKSSQSTDDDVIFCRMEKPARPPPLAVSPEQYRPAVTVTGGFSMHGQPQRMDELFFSNGSQNSGFQHRISSLVEKKNRLQCFSVGNQQQRSTGGSPSCRTLPSSSLKYAADNWRWEPYQVNLPQMRMDEFSSMSSSRDSTCPWTPRGLQSSNVQVSLDCCPKTSVIQHPVNSVNFSTGVIKSATSEVVKMGHTWPVARSSSNVCRISPTRPPVTTCESVLPHQPVSGYSFEYGSGVVTAAIRRPIMSAPMKNFDMLGNSYPPSNSFSSQFMYSPHRTTMTAHSSRTVTAARVCPILPEQAVSNTLRSIPSLTPISGLNMAAVQPISMRVVPSSESAVIDLSVRYTPPPPVAHCGTVKRHSSSVQRERSFNDCHTFEDSPASSSRYARAVHPLPPPAHNKSRVATTRTDPGRCVVLPLDHDSRQSSVRQVHAHRPAYNITSHVEETVPSLVRGLSQSVLGVYPQRPGYLESRVETLPKPAHNARQNSLFSTCLPNCDGMVPRPAHGSRH